MGHEELSCWASVTLTEWTFRQAKGDPWWLRQNLSAVQKPQVPPLGQEDTLRREWLPTPVFLPGESHGQRSLAGSSSWDRKESDTTNTHSTYSRVLPFRATRLGGGAAEDVFRLC